MYITSSKLLDEIEEIKRIVYEKSRNKVVFEEFIVIPHLGGQVILRFNRTDSNYTLDDLDQSEKMISELVGNDYLVDFMGECYRHVGIDYSSIEEKFIQFDEQYKDEPILNTKHYAFLLEDAKELLAKCQLPTHLPVWEIQVEEPMYLIILGKENKVLKETEDIIVQEVMSKPCIGLLKATLYARRNHLSLGRLLALKNVY